MSSIFGTTQLRSRLVEIAVSSADESSSDQESHNCSEHNLQSETEQEVSDYDEAEKDENAYSDLDDIPLALRIKNHHISTEINNPHYTSKDGQKWYKHTPRKNVRTRSENIISHRPGVKGKAKEAATEIECWNNFITNEMKEIILTHTNEQITIRREQCRDPEKLYTMKDTTMLELDALIGLLYIAGLNKSSRQSLKDLWRTDGTGVDIFRTTMSLQRFYFLQNCIRFDSKATRIERKKQIIWRQLERSLTSLFNVAKKPTFLTNI